MTILKRAAEEIRASERSGGTKQILKVSESAAALESSWYRHTRVGRAIQNSCSFIVDKPRIWIEKLGGADWDLSPDGKKVLVLVPLGNADTPKQEHEIVLLENFFDELRRRVPLK